MKTTQFCLLLLLCAATKGTKAQHFYAGLGGGYGFPAAKQSLDYDVKSVYSSSGGSTEYNSHPTSFGMGIHTGLFFGYMLNSNLGFEIGASYFIGSKTQFRTEYSNSDINGGSYYSEQTSVYQGKMIRLIPTIRMSVGEKKLRPYMKAGLIVSLGNKLVSTQSYKSSFSLGGGSNSSESINEYTGGISFGFHGSLGFNYIINDKFMLFAECAANCQNWAPTKGELTKSMQNGVDQLPNMDKVDKEVEFVNSYTEGSNTVNNPNEPATELKFFMPFSSIGLNIGIVMRFGKTSE